MSVHKEEKYFSYNVIQFIWHSILSNFLSRDNEVPNDDLMKYCKISFTISVSYFYLLITFSLMFEASQDSRLPNAYSYNNFLCNHSILSNFLIRDNEVTNDDTWQNL